jgi:hypothetical protein
VGCVNTISLQTGADPDGGRVYVPHRDDELEQEVLADEGEQREQLQAFVDQFGEA